MLNRVADLVIAAPRVVLGICLVLVVAGGIYGRDTAGRLSPAGYEVGGSESTEAQTVLAEQFDTGPANLILLATVSDETVAAGGAAPGGVDGRQARDDGLLLVERLSAITGVEDVASYWTSGVSQLRSDDGTRALVTARIVASEDGVYDRVEQIREEFAGQAGTLEVAIGGSAAANLEIVEESERDLLRAELIAIPITTIIMLLVFRSVVAALLPLVVSAVAVVGTAAVLKAMSEVTLVSIFALNLTTALGLGMGVDFSLFSISRFREERAAGADNETALRTMVNRSGRSIMFSGMTTAATLAALLLFDYPLLRSLAIAGFAVVILATLGALLALPATIAILGDRIDRFQLRGAEPTAVEQGWWYRTAERVMRHPRLTAVVVVGILLLLGTPFLRAQFGIPDDRALPSTSQARQVADQVRAEFDGSAFGAMAAVAPEYSAQGDTDSTAAAGAGVDVEAVDRNDDLTAYAAAVSSVDGVARVETVTGVYQGGDRVAETPTPDRFVAAEGVWLSVVPAVEPISGEAERMVASIRELPAPATFLLGGESARLVDNKAEIESKLVPVGIWVVTVVGLLLYWSFGSVLVPIKAVALNLLSLTAAFGVIVWIFQDGRFSGLLGFTPTGLTDGQTPVLIFCIAFGLSMDYEVFLLSRIKEEWDRTGDTARSVAFGLQRTGGIITAAAVLMAVVFLSFASGHVTFIQMVGVGLAVAIVTDATLVRTFLVPAFMAIAGRFNWWPSDRPGDSVARTVVVEPSALARVSSGGIEL